jgi:hypothetical protein
VHKVCGRKVLANGVDVKGMAVVGTAVAEVVGYPVKMADLREFSDIQIRSLDCALEDRHLVQPCKKWGRRAKEMERERTVKQRVEEAKQGIERLGYVDLVKGIKAGSGAAQELGLELLWYLLATGGSPGACGVLGRNLGMFGLRHIRPQVPKLYLEGAPEVVDVSGGE